MKSPIEILLARSAELREKFGAGFYLAKENYPEGKYLAHCCNLNETKDAIIKELVAALEEFRLGHEHASDLTHIRSMGDSYGWCDYCNAKVSWGPGIAELALEKANALAAKALKNR